LQPPPHEPQSLPGTMDIITRAEAQAQGLTHYFTGVPCRNGHVSVRGVKKWNCLECDRNHKAAERVRDPERVRANERKTAEKHRDKKVQYVRDWREANPEYGIVKSKERWAAIKADPAAHQAQNERMRIHWMNKRREQGVPTRSEFHAGRYERAVERVNSIGLVVVNAKVSGKGTKRLVSATCNFCGEASVSELNCLVNGQGIRCKCRKGGESTLGNVRRMVAEGLVGRGGVYLVPTSAAGLVKYGITSNMSQRMSSHRHHGLIEAWNAAWSHSFETRWQSCLWEMAIAEMYASCHDRHFDQVPGATEVLRVSVDALKMDAVLLASEIDALTGETWEAWAKGRIRKAATMAA
jgi:hypothetical protein